MTTERTTIQSIVRVLLLTAALLAVPLIANQFTAGEGWSVFDYLLAGGLIMGAGLAYELAARRAGTRTSAVIVPLLAAVGGAAIPLGEIDDAPGLMLLGFLLILTAMAIGIRSAPRRSEGGGWHAGAAGSA